jgi:hypothetical protein
MESYRRVLTRKENELVNEDKNPFASPLSSPVLPLNDAPISFPRSAILGSILVMLPWPIIGIVACLSLSLFDELGEAIFMFGSVTMIFLLPLALVTDSMWIFGALSGLVWLLVLLLPSYFGRKSIHPRFRIHTVLVCQSLFSAIQAGLGFLVVLGKQV